MNIGIHVSFKINTANDDLNSARSHFVDFIINHMGISQNQRRSKRQKQTLTRGLDLALSASTSLTCLMKVTGSAISSNTITHSGNLKHAA